MGNQVNLFKTVGPGPTADGLLWTISIWLTAPARTGQCEPWRYKDDPGFDYLLDNDDSYINEILVFNKIRKHKWTIKDD